MYPELAELYTSLAHIQCDILKWKSYYIYIFKKTSNILKTLSYSCTSHCPLLVFWTGLSLYFSHWHSTWAELIFYNAKFSYILLISRVFGPYGKLRTNFFFHWFMAQARSMRAINRWKKKRICNLQYGPKNEANKMFIMWLLPV